MTELKSERVLSNAQLTDNFFSLFDVYKEIREDLSRQINDAFLSWLEVETLEDAEIVVAWLRREGYRLNVVHTDITFKDYETIDSSYMLMGSQDIKIEIVPIIEVAENT